MLYYKLRLGVIGINHFNQTRVQYIDSAEKWLARKVTPNTVEIKGVIFTFGRIQIICNFIIFLGLDKDNQVNSMQVQ